MSTTEIRIGTASHKPQGPPQSCKMANQHNQSEQPRRELPHSRHHSNNCNSNTKAATIETQIRNIGASIVRLGLWGPLEYNYVGDVKGVLVLNIPTLYFPETHSRGTTQCTCPGRTRPANSSSCPRVLSQAAFRVDLKVKV